MPILTRSIRHILLCAVAALALTSAEAPAQGTATVLPSDELYADLDRLSELGVLDSVVIGQRPYSRREIGRILRAARERSNQLGERGRRGGRAQGALRHPRSVARAP